MHKNELNKIKEIYERMTGEKVRGICVQGARMKGIADRTAEHDIFIATSQSFEEYTKINTHNLARYRGNVEYDRTDSRRFYANVSSRVSMEMGIAVSFSTYDVRTIFRGLVDYNPFTAMVIEEMYKTGIHDMDGFKEIMPSLKVDKFYIREYLACAAKNISSSREDVTQMSLFRAEKRYVYALWNLYMAAALINNIDLGDHRITTVFEELHKKISTDKYTTGVTNAMEDIFINRTTREAFVPVESLTTADFDDILKFYDELTLEYNRIPTPYVNNELVLIEANQCLSRMLVRYNAQELRSMLREVENSAATVSEKQEVS